MGRVAAVLGLVVFSVSVMLARHLGVISMVGCAVGFALFIPGILKWFADERRRKSELEQLQRGANTTGESAVLDARGAGVMALGVEVTSRWRLALRRLFANMGAILCLQLFQALTFGSSGFAMALFWVSLLFALLLRDRAALPLPAGAPPKRATRVRVSDGHLILDGKTRIPLTPQRSGFVAMSELGATMTLWVGRHVVFAHMPNRASADALLHAADAAPQQRVVELALAPHVYRKVGTWLATLLVLPLVSLAVFGLGVGAPDLLGTKAMDSRLGDYGLSVLIAFGISLSLVLAWRHMRLPKVTIGADGIEVQGVAPHRFISYDEVGAVSAGDKAVHMTLANGETVELEPQLMLMANLAAGRKAAVQMIAGQILWNMDQRRATASAGGRMHELERRGRPVRTWLDGITRHAMSGQDYRAGFLDADQLERVVADPQETPDRRIGAGMALARSDAPEALNRARIAVGRTAQASLRTAIEHALDGEVELEAIEEATGEESSSRRA